MDVDRDGALGERSVGEGGGAVEPGIGVYVMSLDLRTRKELRSGVSQSSRVDLEDHQTP